MVLETRRASSRVMVGGMHGMESEPANSVEIMLNGPARGRPILSPGSIKLLTLSQRIGGGKCILYARGNYTLNSCKYGLVYDTAALVSKQSYTPINVNVAHPKDCIAATTRSA